MKFTEADGGFGKIKLFSTATPLDDGSILITGGYDVNIVPAAEAWIFNAKEPQALRSQIVISKQDSFGKLQE